MARSLSAALGRLGARARPDYSRRGRVTAVLANGRVRIDGRIADAGSQVLRAGDRVHVTDLARGRVVDGRAWR
jgi:membrane protein implicated in regulation of membrane protease activity